MRPLLPWKLRTRTVELGRRTLVMGVLNATPDSFSDGGAFSTAEEGVARALEMLAQGADILDIGGESTRPGAKVAAKGELGLAGAVSPNEECSRILPIIAAVRKARPEALISVDTYKAEVARRAIEAGAEIVNDVSGLTWDCEMASAVSALGCGLVLMHTRGVPSEWRSLPPEPEIVNIVFQELRERLDLAKKAGIVRERIVLDPGFGFGKNYEENFPLLAQFEKFAELKLPLLAGTSRKSFLGRAAARRLSELTGEKIADIPPQERLAGSLASLAIAVVKGAHIVRVHDVRATVEAVAVVDEVLLRE